MTSARRRLALAGFALALLGGVTWLAIASDEERTAQAFAIAVAAISLLLLAVAFGLALRERRRRQTAQTELDRFFALSPEMLCIAGTDGYFKRLNPAFSNTLGWTADELLARPFLDFVHPDDHAAAIGELALLSRGVPMLQFECRLLHKDGSHSWVSWSGYEAVDTGLIYAAGRDITARRQAEDDIARLNASLLAGTSQLMQFKAALDEHAIVAITDARGKITYANDKFCAISQYAREELLGRDHRMINSGYHPAAFIRDLWQTIGSGRVWHGEIRNRAKDGSFYWVATTIVPFLDDEGTPVQFVALRTDITERKQAEERIARLNADLQIGTTELAEVNRELESFSYSVSHDLRAPLRHIHGYIEMLRRVTAGQLSEKATRYVDTIAAASLEMGQLIDDLLEFSRTAKADMRESRIDLDALVVATVAGLDLAASGRNIVWRVMPLPPVVGDPAMVKQVLVNLVGNAVKYSRQRDPAQIDIACVGEEDGRVVVMVRDNGAGFDMQYAHKLFGVFQRLHRAEEFEGTGIGLATVRRILARHGGRIWAESAVDKGATFYFSLKRAPPEPDAEGSTR